MLISGIALVKQNLTLFTQNFGIPIVVLITMYTDVILRMNRTLYLLSRQCCVLNREATHTNSIVFV